jgi:hypothetical protein
MPGGTWLTTYTFGREDKPDAGCGVALSGYEDDLDELWRLMRRERKEIQSELPNGSQVESGRFGIRLTRLNTEFRDDDEKRSWMKATLNTFVNVLRPRMKRLFNAR